MFKRREVSFPVCSSWILVSAFCCCILSCTNRKYFIFIQRMQTKCLWVFTSKKKNCIQWMVQLWRLDFRSIVTVYMLLIWQTILLFEQQQSKTLLCWQFRFIGTDHHHHHRPMIPQMCIKEMIYARVRKGAWQKRMNVWKKGELKESQIMHSASCQTKLNVECSWILNQRFQSTILILKPWVWQNKTKNRI